MHHFSHLHELELWNALEKESAAMTLSPLCAGCKLPTSGNVYTCRPCNFNLHLGCAHFPQLITHPFDPNHILQLLPTSPYPGGVFNCDACNRRGNGFSYHCSSCEYDLHILCAAKPLQISHRFHSCPLELTFKNPYANTKGFSCDVCRKIGSKEWLYRCSACDFDVHLDCSTVSAPQISPNLLPHQPFPGLTRQNHGFVRPNQSGANAVPLVLQPTHQQLLQPNLIPTSSIQNTQQPDSLMTGALDGASEQVAHSLIQSVIGGGAEGDLECMFCDSKQNPN